MIKYGKQLPPEPAVKKPVMRASDMEVTYQKPKDLLLKFEVSALCCIRIPQ